MAKRDGRTEQATPRRKREARRDGNLPRSKEASSLAVLAAALIVLVITAPSAIRTTEAQVRFWLSSAGSTGGALRFDWVTSSATTMTLAWSPMILAAVVAGIGVQVAQAGLVLAPKSAKPTLKNLSWTRGLRQLSPKEAGMTLLRSTLKVTVVGLALVGPIQALQDSVLSDADLPHVASEVWKAFEAVAWRVVLGSVIIAGLDFLYTKQKWKRDLMMTRQEVIDESKMTEGDPHMKAARKRRGMELRRRSGLPSIAEADVVVTNPTHFAVALAYVDGSPAPQVVGKGTDEAAKKIRKTATRNGVPIIENRPLARALYRQVKVGGYVPEKFFDEVIKVLVAAYWRRGKFPASMRASAPNVSVDTSATHDRGAS
ncbi:MAG: EscU/YscU/HrcU family type III secretion system export apparatus switch protein [Ilumatobacteraceae bacterium]